MSGRTPKPGLKQSPLSRRTGRARPGPAAARRTGLNWRRLRLISLSLALAWPGLAQAQTARPDLLRERDLAESLQATPLVGNPVTLRLQGREFFAIHHEAAQEKPWGGLVMVPDLDGHPDLDNVIRPLRLALTERGWDTLAIQIPLAGFPANREEHFALLPQARERIGDALEYLRQHQTSPLILLGHGLGAQAALEYLINAGASTPFQALVLISLEGSGSEADGNLKALRQIRMPILDVYGSQDRLMITDTTQQRALAAAKAGNRQYRQMEILGTNNKFYGREERLQAIVHSWLVRTLGIPLPRRIPP